MSEKAYQLVEVAKKTGKIRKGSNEVTKALEKEEAKYVVIAEDVTPKEIVMHLPLLCEDKEIKFTKVPSKVELGAAAGLPIGTTAIAIVSSGDGKDLLEELNNQ